jgi:hypothetical protein
MDLIAPQTFHFMRVQRSTQRLSAHSRPQLNLLSLAVVPIYDLGFNESQKAIGVRRIGRLIGSIIVRLPTELVFPTVPRALSH